MNNIKYFAVTQPYAARVNRIVSNLIIESGTKRVKTSAVWDTGAQNSVIANEIVKILGLVPTGKINIGTPSDKCKEVSTYLVNFSLPNNVKVSDIQVCDSEIGGQKIGALIGMYIITLGDFCITNFQNKTTFSYRIPSKEITVYVKIANIDSLKPSHDKGKRK